MGGSHTDHLISSSLLHFLLVRNMWDLLLPPGRVEMDRGVRRTSLDRTVKKTARLVNDDVRRFIVFELNQSSSVIDYNDDPSVPSMT